MPNATTKRPWHMWISSWIMQWGFHLKFAIQGTSGTCVGPREHVRVLLLMAEIRRSPPGMVLKPYK